MAATKLYKGNTIGTSKEEGLFKKLSDEGTELKLLKYQDFLPGIDRAPFVTHDINTGEPTERDSWWKLYVNTSALAVQRRLEDVKRITKFIASPKGILWESERAALETIQKEIQQAQSNRIEKIRGEGGEKDGFWKKVLGVAANFGKSVLQGIGLTAATLEQTGVSGTGAHVTTYLTRSYLLNGKNSKTFTNILAYAGLTDDNNLNASGKILGGDQTIDSMEPDPNRLMVSPDDRRLVSNNKVASQSYGTEAFLGLGTNTYEKNYRGQEITGSISDARTELHGVSKSTGSSEVQYAALSDTRKADRHTLGGKYGDIHGVQNFKGLGDKATERAKTFDEESERYIKDSYKNSRQEGKSILARDSTISYANEDLVNTPLNLPESVKDYYQYNNSGSQSKLEISQQPVEDAVTPTIGRSGSVNLSKNSFSTFDRLSTFYYHTDTLGGKPSGGLYRGQQSTQDLEFKDDMLKRDLSLIPFCITTITPESRQYLNFPAYLDSYDDNYTGEWESVRYVGRAENFYGYKGFTRSINLAFKVLAFNPAQLKPLYYTLNRLVGATAPSYDANEKLFMRGTLASLTIGDLLKEQLGFIPSVRLTWNVDDPWEVDGDLIRVPHVLSVNLQFTPIEKQEVREDYGAYFVFEPEKQKQEVATVAVPDSVVEEKQKAAERHVQGDMIWERGEDGIDRPVAFNVVK